MSNSFLTGKTLNTDWVDFELGEDVREETRLRQDEEWKNAIADGRAHVSNREMAMLNAPQLCLAISDYKLIDELVTALQSNISVLRCISAETLRHIVEYAFPGHGSLVTACTIRRKLAAAVMRAVSPDSNTIDSVTGPAIKETPAPSTSESKAGTASQRGLTFEQIYDVPFRICVRKRPMFDWEHNFGAYDVCSTDTITGLTLHEGKLARNGRQLTMTHHQYVVDRVFGEHASNRMVCEETVEPLVSWAETGRTATLMCFGQTGTGKTYTLYGALEYLSSRLVGHSIRITFYEVHGKKCYDLLKGRNVVHLRSDGQDCMHVRGARQVEIAPLCDPIELLDVLREALSLRSSKVTERNPISSRSHAVCTIEIASSSSTTAKRENPSQTGECDDGGSGSGVKSLGQYLQEKNQEKLMEEKEKLDIDSQIGPHVDHAAAAATATAVETSTTGTFTGSSITYAGKITLVDLAGSERNYETVQMTAAQHKESADINFALMALKDCFRAYHAQILHLDRFSAVLKKTGDTTDNSVPNLFNSSANNNYDLKSSKSFATTTTSSSSNTKDDQVRSKLTATYGSAGDEGNGRAESMMHTGANSGINSASTGNDNNVSSSSSSAIRIPFRANLLTKVLKECFTSGKNHRTTIITTISPTPTDLQHSINSTAHVVLMSPELNALVHR